MAWRAAAGEEHTLQQGPWGRADTTADATGPPEITGGGYGLALSRLNLNPDLSPSAPPPWYHLCSLPAHSPPLMQKPG